MKRKIFFTCLACLLVFSAAGCGLFKSKKPATLTAEERAKVDMLMAEIVPPKSVDVSALPVITPDVLRDAFDENPLNTDLAYDKTWLKLRGKLVAGPLKKETMGVSAYALFLAHNKRQVGCIFYGKVKEAQLAELKTGQELIVVGRYDSTTSGPLLNMCSIEAAR